MSIWEKVRKKVFFPWEKGKNFFPEVKNERGEKTKIFVGVSGGVDSSVSALILKEKGYDVHGVFFKKFNPDKNKCKKEKEDAEKICEQLNIPFHFLDLEEEYKEKILSYFIETYKSGKTPNPDIFCNRDIKFGAFQKWAFESGADYIATGHYGKNIFNKKTNLFELHKGQDENKDQSYFLAMLGQGQLAKSIFPLGGLKKPQVRKIAEKNNLITAGKKDSQGICFLGEKIDLKEFLKNYIPEKKGKVLDVKGREIGNHDGTVFYTIGERHGFEIFPKAKTPDMPRLFVIKKDEKKNTLIVGSAEELKNINSLALKNEIIFSHSSWISEEPDFSKKYLGRVRYRGELISAKLSYFGPQTICRAEVCVEDEILNERVLATFEKNHRFIASGQVVVFYDGEKCLGGGIME